jgi:ABC-type multidrug transport system ATPase subunit
VDAIVAQNVVCRHRSGRGVDGVSLTVRSGRCLGVLGPNGSGKTTLTHLVAGLARADTGCVSVLDGPACPRPAHLRRRCGVSLDTPSHWDSLSGRQNLWFFARQYGLDGSNLRRQVDELLSEADLAGQADEPVAAYSFGMRRKLSVIEALSHDPDLLILDEPSAGVDTAFLEWLVQHIRRRCDRGKTTWIADNDADWVSRAATDAILLREGRIAAGGDVAELKASVGARTRIDILLEEGRCADVPDIPGISAFQREGNHIHAELSGGAELVAELHRWIVSQGGRIRAMEVRSLTLHDALASREGCHYAG